MTQPLPGESLLHASALTDATASCNSMMFLHSVLLLFLFFLPVVSDFSTYGLSVSPISSESLCFLHFVFPSMISITLLS